MQGWQIENCVLYLATVATIISAYYFGAGGPQLVWSCVPAYGELTKGR